MFGFKTLVPTLRGFSTLAHNQEDTSSPKDSVDTWVYVWNLTAKGVGHTAIQVGDSYMSIHPNYIPAVGPTVVFPLPATLTHHITEDMASEAVASKKDNIDENGLARTFAPDVAPNLKAPDRTFKVSGLDTDAMRRAMSRIEAHVESGEASYQLIPRVNGLGFFRELPGYLAQDPVDIELTRKRVSQDTPPEVYNCATLVSHLLQEGGMPPVHSSGLLWSPTPNDIASHLEMNGVKPI